jgi:hypothetical protein
LQDGRIAESKGADDRRAGRAGRVEGQKVRRLEGQKVRRLEGQKVGRLEGRKVEFQIFGYHLDFWRKT